MTRRAAGGRMETWRRHPELWKERGSFQVQEVPGAQKQGPEVGAPGGHSVCRSGCQALCLCFWELAVCQRQAQGQRRRARAGGN